MVIIYRSNTGFTQEYAEMLGKAEKLKVYSASEAAGKVGPEEPVLYMGPLMAGHIGGVDKAVKQYSVKGVCGVGLSPASQQLLDTLSKANYVPGAPIFYLQGGWAPDKVSWIKRRMVNMATKSMRESLRGKGHRRTPDEEALYQALLKGGNFVSFDKLRSIRIWLRSQEAPAPK